ncbi:MAG TPA: lysophospholipid acyltransferase family protein [Gemmatimonadaceae bacterium]|nr:lysophospholipid acyltransferase family protein [Gemmatimonadaceae bacterium]
MSDDGARSGGNPKVGIIASLGTWIIRALAATWRVRFVNPDVCKPRRDRDEPIIYVLWHGQILPLLWTHRKRDISVIISRHRDGEIIARIAKSLGFRLVRGSTSRDAARALLNASREIEAGHDLAVTVDGPRGPAGVVAPGALVIAQRTGVVLIPTGASASRAWRLRSWDRFLVPKPFARVTVAYGQPIRVAPGNPRDATQHVERVRDAIETAIASADAG